VVTHINSAVGENRTHDLSLTNTFAAERFRNGAALIPLMSGLRRIIEKIMRFLANADIAAVARVGAC
jgi:hypothetical protein